MAVLTTPRFPAFGKMTTYTDRVMAEKVLPWLVAALSFVLGLTLLKSALVTLLMKLYEYLIQKNVLKL